jgi:hypothetical protein
MWAQEAAEAASMVVKENGMRGCQVVGCTVRWRNLRDKSSTAVARAGVGGTTEGMSMEAAGVRPQVLAWLRAAEAGSKTTSGGRPKEAAARVIGKSMLRERLCKELVRREMTESKSQSMGSPKTVFTVTSEPPRAKEMVMLDP